MSKYVDRVGQWIGDALEVRADHKRTRAGKVIWRCWDHGTERSVYLSTYELIRRARQHGCPAPTSRDGQQ